jgi:hypothetical protein
MHELGHAFGLLQEHQRTDHSDFFQYLRKTFVSYDDALKRASEKGYGADELCKSRRCAAELGFAATQFTIDGAILDPATGSKQSDIDSIMHYISGNFADPQKFGNHRGDPSYYLLVKMDSDHKLNFDVSHPYPDFYVTDINAEGLNAMYPRVSAVMYGDKMALTI